MLPGHFLQFITIGSKVDLIEFKTYTRLAAGATAGPSLNDGRARMDNALCQRGTALTSHLEKKVSEDFFSPFLDDLLLSAAAAATLPRSARHSARAST